jgi:hypothetical protein
MVTVPVRTDVLVLAPAAHVMVVVPVPADGEVTVTNALLLAAVHPQVEALAVSVTDPLARLAGIDADGEDSENVHGPGPATKTHAAPH